MKDWRALLQFSWEEVQFKKCIETYFDKELRGEEYL
jgi:hypothetical protein